MFPHQAQEPPSILVPGYSRPGSRSASPTGDRQTGVPKIFHGLVIDRLESPADHSRIIYARYSWARLLGGGCIRVLA